MSETAKAPARASRTELIAGVLLVLLIGIGFAVMKITQANERAQQVDEYYCTLSGVGLFDRGPETGDLCADILSR